MIGHRISQVSITFVVAHSQNGNYIFLKSSLSDSVLANIAMMHLNEQLIISNRFVRIQQKQARNYALMWVSKCSKMNNVFLAKKSMLIDSLLIDQYCLKY
ncbi:hypothetical protein X798_00673 [Onchocerca flexuosa]|uniref:Uncharacterized protein n=1 Tax=Onchocerca flexuosa TaxID=387005 RepID=A0A238C3V9_9BILA|nr:hypothetical protein X798_00673 [Onchocerca flexuosa]